MIKLKDILSESTNVKLHKVITDKTEPPFMTEEQWQNKWSNNKCAISENIITEADEKEAKKVIKKKLPLLKRLVLQYAAKRARGYGKLSPDKVRKIIHRYLKTGKLSKSDAVDIYTDVRAFVWGNSTGAIIAAAMFATFSFIPLLVTPIAFAVLGYLTSRGDFLSKFFPKDLSDEDIQEYERLVRKRYDTAKMKAGPFKSILK